ncbi:uncharacterized protein LOC126575704 [Anopheles aquasalis]|uniref:uncharacterized protein LOC126575704 n=1 Tax=Anopheles aquasalis TaxID=42839 RepID=UPI00215ABAFC|nr:uncharacterized protein LOC126575704 [Anopheles aquasalis]
MMDCAICFERINVDQKLLRCGHQFHGGCVDQWFCQQKRGSCPLCRTPITPRRRNDSSLGRTMEVDDSEEEAYVDNSDEDQYEEDRYEEDDTYEAISDDEVEYSDIITEDDTASTVEIGASATASDNVDESMDLESISSTESFSNNESQEERDSDETDGEERVADGQSS